MYWPQTSACVYIYVWGRDKGVGKVPRSMRFCVFLCWERTRRGGRGVLCYAYPYRGVFMRDMNSLWVCVCVWVRDRLLRKSAPVKAFLHFFMLRATRRRRAGEVRMRRDSKKALFSRLFLIFPCLRARKSFVFLAFLRFCSFRIRKTFIFLAFF